MGLMGKGELNRSGRAGQESSGEGCHLVPFVRSMPTSSAL